MISEGIDAAKIEGRARPAEYLVPIIKAYRKAIDRYYEDPYAYATDFEDFEKLHGNRVRDYTTNYAFKDTGPSACDHTGKREPRFFSLAADEKGIDSYPEAYFHQEPHPRKARRTGHSRGQVRKLPRGCGGRWKPGPDLVYVGGEFFDKKNPSPWTRTEMKKLAEYAWETKKQVGIATPRIMTKRELFEFERMPRPCDGTGNSNRAGIQRRGRWSSCKKTSPGTTAFKSWRTSRSIFSTARP